MPIDRWVDDESEWQDEPAAGDVYDRRHPTADYEYEPVPGQIIESVRPLSGDQQREFMESGSVDGVPGVRLKQSAGVGQGERDPRFRSAYPDAPPTPAEPEKMGLGEYLGSVAKGFVKTAGGQAARVADAGGLGMLGIGPEGSPVSRDAIVRYLSEKLGAAPDTAMPTQDQAFKPRGGPEILGSVGERVATGSGVAGAVGAGLGATASIPAMAIGQGAGAAAEAEASGDHPLVAGALGAAGVLGGAAFQGIRKIRQGRAAAAEAEAIRQAAHVPSPTQLANEALGVKPRHLGKNPATAYKPAEAAIDHGIDLNRSPREIRLQGEGRMDDVSRYKEDLLDSGAQTGPRRDAFFDVLDELDNAHIAAKDAGNRSAMRMLDDNINSLTEQFDKQKGTLNLRDVENLKNNLQQRISMLSGNKNKPVREALQRAKAKLGARQVATEPELAVANDSKRHLSSTLKAAREKEIAEMASPGPPLASPEKADAAMSPEMQAAARAGIGASGINRIAGPFAGYALLRYLEEKMRGR